MTPSSRRRSPIPWSLSLLLITACAEDERLVSAPRADQIGDHDCDGIPTDVELDLGLDPFDPADADDDFDGDRVPTAIEIRLGGSPRLPDTDGNGVGDDQDLAASLDLDGDGVRTPFDVCPEDVDPAQRDTDGDGIGDACDRVPTGQGDDLRLVALAEAYDARAADWALWPLASGSLSRLVGDRAGLLSMPGSFRVLAAPFAGGNPVSRPLHELYHPARRDHGYATREADRAALLHAGYVDQGVLGYLTDAALPFGAPVLVRRFRRVGGGEAVAIDPATVERLIKDGYQEQTALGFAVVDEGRLRRPVSIVRTRAPGVVERHLHYRHTAAELGMTSDGPRFRVWPERLGRALPLHRLRDPGGAEVLGTDAAEVASLIAAGHSLDGILGWVLIDETAMPVAVLQELWRLEDAGGRQVYSADPAEIDARLAEGFARRARLGFVAAPDEPGPACAGRTPVERLEEELGAMADQPRERSVAALSAIVSSCAIERLLDGNPPASPYETAVAARLPFDPEARRRLRATAAVWQAIDPGVRADALGELAPLDPGTCSAPVDIDRLRAQAGDILFEYVGPPPSLREEFCDGTLYADGDPDHGTAKESRAVTIDAKNGGEISTSNRAKPRLDGVLDTEFVRGHPILETAAAANPDRGYPLEGVSNGAFCVNDAGCAASQGLKCVDNQCWAFPILQVGHGHSFTGVNLWDVVDGQIAFRDTVTNSIRRLPDAIVSGEPEDDSRCDLFGVRNHATVENLPLVPGRFYEVIAVNKNGNFFEHDETVPADKDTARAAGRTIHVCWRPADPARPPDTITDCEPVAPAAACPVDGPPCGETTGGRWGLTAGQKPRSLALCSGTGVNCGETPREFTSEGSGPHFVFVETMPPLRTVATTLEGVTCHNETGWDILGGDELAVSVTRFGGTLPPGESLAMGDVFQRDMDSGDHDDHIGHELSALELVEAIGADGDFRGKGVYVLQLVEEDGWLAQALAGTGLLAGAGQVFNFRSSGWIAALLLLHQMFGPDDKLGGSAFEATVFDVTDRGALSHGVPLNPIPTLTVLDSPAQQFENHARDYVVSVHPAVDNDPYGRNQEVRACQAPAQCKSSETCLMGACVPNGWIDTVPGEAGQPPGFVERREFEKGLSWRYEVYLGWHTR